MSDVVLHHYEVSPYAEKARLMLGFKALAWKSVEIPMLMPKPDLTCLTGGYRRTPVLQIGADVYCDTKAIARVLEQIRPEPTLFPAGNEASERALSAFGDAMFLQVVTVLLGCGFFPRDFMEDRRNLFGAGFDAERARRDVPVKRDQLHAALAVLDAQLSDGRRFLLGTAPSLADFSIHGPVSLLRLTPPTASLLAPFARVAGWRERVAAVGEGRRTEISAADAIVIAYRSEPETGGGVEPNPNGYAPGDRLSIAPDDYGCDPVVGELVALDSFEIAIRRSHPRVGSVVVHFPQQGFVIMRSSEPG